MNPESAEHREATALAHQRRNANRAAADLRLAIRHLEGAQKAARLDGLLDQGATASRLIRETTTLLRGWPTPSRERAIS